MGELRLEVRRQQKELKIPFAEWSMLFSLCSIEARDPYSPKRQSRLARELPVLTAFAGFEGFDWYPASASVSALQPLARPARDPLVRLRPNLARQRRE